MAIKITTHNLPHPGAYISPNIAAEASLFLTYTPDFEMLGNFREKYKHKKKLIHIANGGSLSSFYAFYHSFLDVSEKQVYFVNTLDPDYIAYLRNICDTEETLVVTVSKSGENTSQVEGTLQFSDYEMLLVTAPGSYLEAVGKAKGWNILTHPSIGGRYTGLTEVNLLSAALCGFNVQEIFLGGREVQKSFYEENDIYKLARSMNILEQQGFVDCIVPIYSKFFCDYYLLLAQLCHESFGKGGKGQTYIGFEAPEAQHHTTQRLYGGTRSMAAFFVGFESSASELITTVGREIAELPYKSATLKALDGISLQEAMRFEMQANIDEASELKVPTAEIWLERRTYRSAGEFLAFWQLYAIYSSIVREVNPFDQPEVEHSKKLSFESRLRYKQPK
ncbi:MAG TPA: hypothetical protein VEA59_02715 [Patescibacteria group bacterium]|nr:hypothetical protein [Patescibacteria group bacterium]